MKKPARAPDGFGRIVRDMIAEGKTWKQIVAKIGYCDPLCRKWRKELGIELPKKGQYPEDRVWEIRRLRGLGLSWRSIAAKTGWGWSHYVCQKVGEANGLPVRLPRREYKIPGRSPAVKKAERAWELIRHGMTMQAAAAKVHTRRDRLGQYIAKHYKAEFAEIIAARRLPDETIAALWQEYKSSSVSQAELARRVNVHQSTLSERFAEQFSDEHRQVILEKRGGLSEDFIKSLWNRYVSLNMGLRKLAAISGVDKQTLVLAFEKRYGDRFRRIADQRRQRNSGATRPAACDEPRAAA